MKLFMHEFTTKVPRYWFAVWNVIYIAILTLSIFVPSNALTSIIKVSSITLCFVYAFIISPRDHLLTIALATTVIADFFLAFDNTSPVGLLIFVVAQTVHLFRLVDKHYYKTISLCAICAAIMIAACFITEFAPPIYAICTVYAIVIACNLLACWHWHRTQPDSLPAALAGYGFILFACCDIWVAVSYLSLTAVLPAILYGIANFLAWFFYYPSQILISNSGKYATMDTVEGKS